MPRPAEQRLTLLVAWYAADQMLKRPARLPKGLAARAALPRATRRRTWPAELALQPDDLSSRATDATRAAMSSPPEVTPAWEDITGANVAESDEATLAESLPPGNQTHFFRVHEDDVAQRLEAEHGAGGTYTRSSLLEASGENADMDRARKRRR